MTLLLEELIHRVHLSLTLTLTEPSETDADEVSPPMLKRRPINTCYKTSEQLQVFSIVRLITRLYLTPPCQYKIEFAPVVIGKDGPKFY